MDKEKPTKLDPEQKLTLSTGDTGLDGTYQFGLNNYQNAAEPSASPEDSSKQSNNPKDQPPEQSGEPAATAPSANSDRYENDFDVQSKANQSTFATESEPSNEAAAFNPNQWDNVSTQAKSNPGKSKPGKKKSSLTRVSNLNRRNLKSKTDSSKVVKLALFGFGVAVLSIFGLAMTYFIMPMLQNYFYTAPEVRAFQTAKAIPYWPESKAKMSQALADGSKVKLPWYTQALELTEFGNALSDHSEYREAYAALRKSVELSKSDSAWTIYTVLMLGKAEHKLAMSDPSFKPNFDEIEKTIQLAKTANSIFREAELTAVLGEFQYDAGNADAGDKLFQEAIQLDKSNGFAYEERQIYESWWAVKMHRLLGKLQATPKPASTSLVTTAHGDTGATEALGLLKDRKFDQLTDMFSQAEKVRQVNKSGTERIDSLIDSLTDLGSSAEPAWLARLQQLKSWVAAKPNSPIPHAVLANFYNNYGWKARSNGWGKDVKAGDWLTFSERLLLGVEQLDSALTLGPPGPEWFDIAQVNFLGGTHGKKGNSDYAKLVELGTASYPNYMPIYLNKTYFLQPRWHGRKSQWLDFVTNEANRRGGDEGDKFYARMVSHVSGLYKNIYQEFPKLSKARVDKGESLLAKEFAKHQ